MNATFWVSDYVTRIVMSVIVRSTIDVDKQSLITVILNVCDTVFTKDGVFDGCGMLAVRVMS